MGVFSLVVLLLWILVKSEQSDSPLWCGKPPTCKCFKALRRVHCTDIEKMPEFKETLRKTLKSIIITNPSLCEFPDQIVNKSKFPSLKNLNILKTCIDCKSVERYHNKRTDMNIISKCVYNMQADTTIKNIVTGRGPSGTEREEEWTEGTTSNSTFFWVTEGTTGHAKQWIVTCTSWMNAGYVLTAINVIGIIILVMFVVMRCRRQRTKCLPRCIQRVKNRQTGTEEARQRIENIGALSVSEESIELFSAPTLKRHSLEREIRPKLC